MDCLDKTTANESAITKNLVGSSFLLAENELSVWITFQEGDEGTVLLNENCGQFKVTADGISITFDESIVAQCGSCIYFQLDDDCEECPECITDLTELDEDTRFVVLDDNDCPTLHVKWGQICEFIAEQTCIKVCKQLCEMGAISDVTAGMKLVAVMGEGESCSCGLIDANKLQCDSDPEPFCCGNDPCVDDQ